MSRARPRLAGIRHAVWALEDGAYRALLLVTQGRDCLGVLVAYDLARREWRIGRARLPAHAIRASRETVAGAIRTAPADGTTIAAIGVFDSVQARLAAQAALYVLDMEADGTVRGKLAAQVQRIGYCRRRDLGPPGRMAFDGYDALPLPAAAGYLDQLEAPDYLTSVRTWRVVDVPAPAPGPPPDRYVELALDPGANLDSHHGTSELVRPILLEWTEALAGAMFPPGLEVLRQQGHWSNALWRRLHADGKVGTYRRQAALLHPMFMPVLLSDPGLSGLVDAGRPFEKALLDRVRPWVRKGERSGLTQAKLRRLRAFPRSPHLEDVRRLLSWSALLPLHAVPRTPSGWRRLDWVQSVLGSGIRRYGLDPVRILAPLLVGASDQPLDSRAPGSVGSLRRASDMIERFAGTVVLPAFPGLAAADANRAAARLLLRDLDLKGIDRLQALWHARLQAFEKALPEGRDLVEWPALSAPWASPDGSARLAFLTRGSELRAEGAHGLDREGGSGLGHCVGGYARRCYGGTSHVASLRLHDGKAWVRASTVEFQVSPEGGVSVTQHKGVGNAEPAPEARRALAAFEAAIASGAHALDAEALAARTEHGFLDGLDWSDRRTCERALRAWRPFLRGDAAREGYDALVTRLERLLPE